MIARWYLNCKCGHNFSVSDNYAGLKVKCRKCGERIYIPKRLEAIGITKVWLVAVLITYFIFPTYMPLHLFIGAGVLYNLKKEWSIK